MAIYGVNIVGSLTNNNGALSGFSANDYAMLNTPFSPTGNNWEVCIKFTTAASYTTDKYYYIFSSIAGNWYGISIIMKNNYPEIEISHDNSGVLSGYTSTLSTPLSASTEYYLKLTFDGSVYTLSLSADGSNYTSIGTLTSSLKPYTPLQATYLGRTLMSDSTTEYFNGIINLDGCYIKIDNTTWWQGVHLYNGTHIQLRRDTVTNWTTFNPVLLEGEVGLELDTGKSKVGDGSTAWNSLAYDLGSTALQSITSTNVTNALGYTPVNKAGDTMTGSLKFNNTGLETIVLQNIGEGSFSDIRFFQQNNKRVGHIRGNNVSSTSRNIQIMPCADNGDPTIALEIGYKNSSAYCTFPNTTCVDGQWTVIDENIAISYTLGAGASQSWTISSLPYDGYEYEVLGTITAKGNNPTIVLASSIINKPNRIITTSGASAVFIFPISSNRIISLHNYNNTDSATIDYFRVYGYRRIGTNS